MSYERKCCVCGKVYDYCPNCNRFNSDEKWRLVFCSNECKDIYTVFDNYAAKKIQLKEAFESLKGKTVNELNSRLKPVIDEILQYKEEIPVVEENVEPEVEKQPENFQHFKKKNKYVK